MSRSHEVVLNNTALGDVEVTFSFESKHEIYIEAVRNIPWSIRWYMPEHDYTSIETLVYETEAINDIIYDMYQEY
jgi:hypothetical protein